MEHDIIICVLTGVMSILASSGVWTYIQNRQKHNSAESKMLLGLAHDRIMSLGLTYIERGYITTSEYENLHDYLYVPYKNLGGNGSAKHVMQEIEKLEIRKD